MGERGHVLFSDNRGQRWTQAAGVPTRELLTAVCFADEKHGVAVGHDEIVLLTTDAGNSWQRDALRAGSSPAVAGRALQWRRTSSLWALTAPTSRAPIAGVTWQGSASSRRRRRPPAQKRRAAEPLTYDDGLGADFHLNRIVGASGSRLYIAAEAGHLYRSDDAGTTLDRAAFAV